MKRLLQVFLAALSAWVCTALPASGAANPTAAAAAEREGAELALDLASQVPTTNTTVFGYVNLRTGEGERLKIPLTYTIEPGPDGWRETFVTQPLGKIPGQRLVITHRGTEPNTYELGENTESGQPPMTALPTKEANVPFAGSDYLLTDLGRDFFHWPGQRIVKDARIRMRLGRPCKVLESSNPEGAKPAYKRVLSWVDAETGALIYAEAYNLENRLLKVFSLKRFKKIQGRWQARDLELRNEQTDSRTQLEFNFEVEAK